MDNGKKEYTIAVKVSESFRDKVTETAWKRRVSLSELVREALIENLKKY